MAAIVLVALVIVAILGAGVVRRSRARALANIRADWGHSVERPRRMDAIAASHHSRVAHLGSTGSLDDRTWQDLNLDDVFAALDRTESTLGQHALYHRLRTAPVADHLEAFELLVSRLAADAPARERAQLALSRLQDSHGYDLWWLAGKDAVEIRSWYALFPLLATGTLVLAALSPFWAHAMPALVVVVVINVIVRYLTDFRIGAVAGAFRQLAPVISTGQSLRFLVGADVQPLIGPLQSDTQRLGRLKTIARWIAGDPLMLPMRSGSSALFVNDVVTVAYEYLNLLFLLDANGVYFGAGELRTHGAAFLRVTAAIGEVDAAVSVASVRTGRADWTVPRFAPAGAPAVWRDVRHPLIDDAVPNAISLPLAHGALVTGSNMSGKSTFVRTIGVTTVMAQTLNTCLATKYEAPILRVRSSIGRSDDLLSGTSYYVAEVRALLGLVDASADTSSHLFLLDELFRGTNAVERIAAAQAVLRELVIGGTGTKPHLVMAATHDGELVDLLADNYHPYHFGDAVVADGLVFDHRLQQGRATTRNAIALLRLYGASETLVARAMSCAEELDRRRGTSVVGR